MARGHLTRSPSGHLTGRTGRSLDSPSGSTFTIADGLADFLVSGRARGLTPKTLGWYAMIGERFAAFRTGCGADPALSVVKVAEARAFVVSLQEQGLAPSSVAGFAGRIPPSLARSPPGEKRLCVARRSASSRVT